MTVLDDNAGDLRREVAELQRRLAERDSENAELQRRLAEHESELAEAVAQQAASSEVLLVINSSSGHLAPVFDAMLQKATRLCEASHGILRTWDGERFHLAVVHGDARFKEWAQQRSPFVPEHAGGPLARLVQGEQVVPLTDALLDPAYQTSPGFREMVDASGLRSGIAVALRKDDALLGSLTVYRREIRPFSDNQVALLQNFAAQAVIAMENARLITETREALEQQTATAEVLGVINASPGDLAPVFDAMLEKATRLCEAAAGTFWVADGEQWHPVAIRGMSEHFVQSAAAYRPSPSSPVGQIASGEKLVHLADLAAAEVYRAGDVLVRAAVDQHGIRTLLSVPLRKEHRLLGVFSVYRREVRPFTDKQVTLVQNFAEQAVIAIENARLITETREALEQQTATAEVLGIINSSPGNLQPVFDAMLEKATRLCEAASGHLYTCEGEAVRLVAAHGDMRLAEYIRQRGLFQPAQGVSQDRVLHGEQVVHIVDAFKDDAYRAMPTFAQMSALGAVRTLISVALRKEDNSLLGILTIYRREVRPFSDKEIGLLESFAGQAVIAMENARLITETREALEQQTATAEVLGVINSSPGNLTPVFDAMVEKAMRLCDAANGVLRTFDGELFHLVSAHGEPEAVKRLRELGPIRSSSFFWGSIARGEPVVHIADMRDTDVYRQEAAQERIDIFGIRTWMAVPMSKDGAVVGAIAVFRKDVRPFSDSQIALLQNFAAQAVIAIENARLITETREALEQQTATAEVLGVINSSPGDLAPVFDAILEKAHILCGAPQGGMFLREGDLFRAVATRGMPERFAERLRQGIGPDAPVPSPLVAGEPFVYIRDMAEIDHPTARMAVEVGAARSLLAVPLRKGDALFGMIVAGRRELRPYSDKEIALLQNFAAQAVIAMENARLLGELRQRTEEVAELNRGLEARVADQVEELGRVGRLKRFLAPQLAELIVSQGDEKILESHRREIVVVFCDLRGYTAFTETAEPEEVLDFLREYHGALGPLVSQFEGTLDQFSGDGIMVFFNDPVPVPDPAERAVKMAIAMRETASRLISTWRQRDRELGFGAGIAQGYATLGQIGFADRSGYTAIGTVCNLAARLCGEAKDGQILVAGRVAAAVRETTALEDIGPLVLKGLTQPVSVFNVKGLIAG